MKWKDESVPGQVIESFEAEFFPFPSNKNEFSIKVMGRYSLLILL
jgi:hypothetical protein